MIWKTTNVGAATFRGNPANWSEASETGKQLRRFIVVGTLSVLTDLSLYYALIASVTDAATFAKAMSYLGGVLVGFVLNKQWTFESKRRKWTEPASYVALYTVTLGVNIACNHLLLFVWI